MNMISLGDLARTLMTQRNVTATKTAIQTLSQEVTTGRMADPAAGLGGHLAPLHGLDAALARLEAHAASAADLQLRAGAMQAALTRLDSGAADLAADLATAVSGGAVALGGMAAAGESGFLQAVAALNTNVTGRHVFSGMASDRAPLPAGETLLAQLRGVAAGADTAAELRQRLENWFADPGNRYLGEAVADPVPLAEGEVLALTATATDPAVGQALAGFALAALLPDLAGAEQAGAATMAAQALRAAQPGLDALAGRIGLAEERIAEAQGRNAAESAALSLARAELTRVDAFDAATRLTDAQDRLELIFTVTARISGLKLSDYLR